MKQEKSEIIITKASSYNKFGRVSISTRRY